MICHSCKNEISAEGFISRSDECSHCGADLHCCLNCVNYDPYAHNRCREPQAEWVSNREKANFCDFFVPAKIASAGGPKKATADDAKAAFDNLFKK
ncbi:MAG: hypothetical protein ACLGJB_15235 [Blastocatellia bacterium]